MLRNTLGAAILLGLEVLVAADLIRTITSKPSIEDAVILGLIVIIRTVLSISIQIEIEGTLPWRRALLTNGGQVLARSRVSAGPHGRTRHPPRPPEPSPPPQLEAAAPSAAPAVGGIRRTANARSRIARNSGKTNANAVTSDTTTYSQGRRMPSRRPSTMIRMLPAIAATMMSTTIEPTAGPDCTRSSR